MKTLFSQYIFKLFVCKFGEKMLKFNMTHWIVVSTEKRDVVVFNVETKEFTGSISVFQDKGSDTLHMGVMELGSNQAVICKNMSEKAFLDIMLEMIEPPVAQGHQAPAQGERAPADNMIANCAVFSKN
jgi:hypothetical protein